MFYRFINVSFVEAKTFEEAKQKLIEKIQSETENPKEWHECTCLGLTHRHECHLYEIPY